MTRNTIIVAITMAQLAFSANTNSGQLDSDILLLQQQVLNKQRIESEEQKHREQYMIELSAKADGYMILAYNELRQSGVKFDNLAKYISEEDRANLQHRIDGETFISTRFRGSLFNDYKLAPSGLAVMLSIRFMPLGVPMTSDYKLANSCKMAAWSGFHDKLIIKDVGRCIDFISGASKTASIDAVKTIIVSALNSH